MNQPDEKPKRKEMLHSEIGSDGRMHWWINFSSLEILNACPRKAYYYFLRNLRSDNESDATLFGSAIHKGLEVWYSLPSEMRILPDSAKKTAELYAAGHKLEELQEGTLEALRQFAIKASPLNSLTDKDKRTPANGIKILQAYFKRYQNDVYSVMHDDKGPMIERRFEFKLWENDNHVINYFGTIDAVLLDQQINKLVVCDHKTTSMLGNQFFDRFKPNHQYSGYVMGAKQVLDIDTDSFMINAIRVSATNPEFARQMTTRNDEDFAEMRINVIHAITNWCNFNLHNEFPMTAPTPCTNYGKCQYHDLCSVPKNMREQIINVKYGENNAIENRI